jgi:hypothetical protein
VHAISELTRRIGSRHQPTKRTGRRRARARGPLSHALVMATKPIRSMRLGRRVRRWTPLCMLLYSDRQTQRPPALVRRIAGDMAASGMTLANTTHQQS